MFFDEIRCPGGVVFDKNFGQNVKMIIIIKSKTVIIIIITLSIKIIRAKICKTCGP